MGIVTTVSAAKDKGTKTKQDAPREGTRRRRLYDFLQQHRGRWVQFDPVELGYRRVANGYSGMFNALHPDKIALEDNYGLDIRVRVHGNKGGDRPGLAMGCDWLLAGEWFGKVYIDYVAEREAKEDRE